MIVLPHVQDQLRYSVDLSGNCPTNLTISNSLRRIDTNCARRTLDYVIDNNLTTALSIIYANTSVKQIWELIQSSSVIIVPVTCNN